MTQPTIHILLKEIGDMPEIAHLQLPVFLRVVDIIKEGGLQSCNLLKALPLPDSYVRFAIHVQHPRSISIERLYKAFTKNKNLI